MLSIFQAFVACATLWHADAADLTIACFSESKPQCTAADMEVIASTQSDKDGETWYKMLMVAGVAGMGAFEKSFANLKTQAAERGLTVSDTCFACQAMSTACGFHACGFKHCSEPQAKGCIECGAKYCSMAQLCGGDPTKINLPEDENGPAAYAADVEVEMTCGTTDVDATIPEVTITTQAPKEAPASGGSSGDTSSGATTTAAASDADSASGASRSGVGLLMFLIGFSLQFRGMLSS